MENLLIALNCVLPIFSMLAVGYLAKRCGVVSEEIVPQLNRLCFSTLLSLYMFSSVYSSDFSRAFSPALVLFLVVQTLFLFAIGFLIVSQTVRNHHRCGAYLQAIFRSNIAIIGIALAQTLTDEAGVASMTIVITVMVPIYNILAVIALESFRGTQISIRHTLKSILKNELIIGSLMGLLFSLLHIRLPSAIESAINSLGKAGTVLALVTLGISFDFSSLKKNRHQIALLSSLRLIIIPMISVLVAVLLGFRHNDLAIIMLTAASPMASTAFSIARIYDSDYELTGQVVVTTSLFCSLTFFLWIFSLKQLRLI